MQNFRKKSVEEDNYFMVEIEADTRPSAGVGFSGLEVDGTSALITSNISQPSG